MSSLYIGIVATITHKTFATQKFNEIVMPVISASVYQCDCQRNADATMGSDARPIRENILFGKESFYVSRVLQHSSPPVGLQNDPATPDHQKEQCTERTHPEHEITRRDLAAYVPSEHL